MADEAANLMDHMRKVERTVAERHADLRGIREALNGVSRRLSPLDGGLALIDRRPGRLDARVMPIARRPVEG